MSNQEHYAERAHATRVHPLDLAVALAKSYRDEPYVLYEKAGEWVVARGAAFEVMVDAHGVCRVDPTARRSWSRSNAIAAVEEALASIPLRGWRAYGTASFELAYLLHGMERDGAEAASSELVPWLHLCVPEIEVHLRQGQALVRVLDGGRLDAEVELVASLDRACATNGDGGPSYRSSAPSLLFPRGAQDDETEYKALVRRATREIAAGQLQKVIASRVVEVPSRVDILATYAAGRRRNSPARSFVIVREDLKVAGLSPETVLEVEADGRVSTQPLAGTRALVAEEAENTRLRAELLRDTKELAEHAMSVRLAVEELQRVCRDDSVVVSDFMSVYRRGSVQHLGSRVTGILESGKSAWSAFRALFPAITVSGVPKREALDWIRQHEREARGLYGGAVLTVDADGSMDAALILRTIFQSGARTWLRAGAGIVEQSTPEREFEETCEKLDSIAPHIVTVMTDGPQPQREESAHA